jgi:hypothetical protein
MKLLISLSRKQVGELYHGTRKGALLAILKTGKLQLTLALSVGVEENLQRGKAYFSSLTRSRFGEYHFKHPDHKSVTEDTDVMITLDGTSMSDRYKIVPVDYWGTRGNDGADNEIEERLVSDKPEVDILKYIKRVDFIQPAVMGEKETYGMDKGKFKVKENEYVSKLLGSVILRLKTNNIPYAFYHNMRDWAMYRNEYTYIGKKEVEPSKGAYKQRLSSYEVKDLEALIEALSDKTYEEMNPAGKSLANRMREYWHDAPAMLNVIGNSRKPDAHPYVRQLVSKLTRMIRRKKLTTTLEIAKFIQNKANVYYDKKALEASTTRAQLSALELQDMLAKDVSDWEPQKGLNSFDSPMETTKRITDRFSYLTDQLERMIKNTLSMQDVPGVQDLIKLMRKMDLIDEMDLRIHVLTKKLAASREEL